MGTRKESADLTQWISDSLETLNISSGKTQGMGEILLDKLQVLYPGDADRSALGTLPYMFDGQVWEVRARKSRRHYLKGQWDGDLEAEMTPIPVTLLLDDTVYCESITLIRRVDLPRETIR
jgi:hypothetical protein